MNYNYFLDYILIFCIELNREAAKFNILQFGVFS